MLTFLVKHIASRAPVTQGRRPLQNDMSPLQFWVRSRPTNPVIDTVSVRFSVYHWISDENHVSYLVVSLPEFDSSEHLVELHPGSLLPLPLVLLHVSTLG